MVLTPRAGGANIGHNLSEPLVKNHQIAGNP